LIAEEKRMYSRVLKSMIRVLALMCVVLAPVALAAQAQDAAKPAAKAAVNDSPSRWDIFAGYSFFWPKGTVTGQDIDGLPVSVGYKTNRVGTTESLSYYLNKNLGWQVDSGQHDRYIDTGNSNTGYSNSGILSVQTGPVYRFPGEDITPFVHAMVGFAQVEGPDHQPYKWGPTMTAGAGFDYQTPWFNHHLSLRLIQADYEYIHANFGTGGCIGGTPVFVPGGIAQARPMYGCAYQPGGRANIGAARLSAGLVFHIHIAPPPPITIACSASPASVFPGDPVSVTATAGGLDPKLNAIYSWGGAGVTGTGTTASVATAALAPGAYTVNCGVKEGKAGKEGLKPWEVANSTATFTVKAFEPPTISCSASPSTIKPDETSTVTAMGMSPQNRPLTYSYSAAAGSISGTGTTAVFSSTGAPTGTTAITCTVSDDKGQTATANTTVTITAPYVKPIPHAQALCSISFSTDKKRPARVDNEAKACLDEVALDLQKESDAKAVVVGDSTAAEKTLPKHAKKHAKVEDFAGERAVNTKEYLVTEKGIDASRISVTTGATDGQKVEDYLVPSGATFTNDVTGTTPVDETVVKPQVRKPLAEKHAAKKHADKKSAN
jgi:hypothetical protein